MKAGLKAVSPMKIALTGAGGQLGQEILTFAPSEKHWRVVAFDRAHLDVTDRELVFQKLEAAAPDVVVSCAADIRVDLCETNARHAYAVNLVGQLNQAEFCRAHGVRMLYFSTDYIFDGEKQSPYLEEDMPRPLQLYGATKLAGEYAVRSIVENHLILRIGGLYGLKGTRGGLKGGNFVEKVLTKAKAGETLKVVTDQIATPTTTKQVVRVLPALLQADVKGVFHATAQGECSYFELAKIVFKLLGLPVEIEPVTSREFNLPARRPPYSVLENKRLKEEGLDAFNDWQQGLEEYLMDAGYLKP